MINSLSTTLQEVASQPLGLLFALLLGMVSAVASACCTLPAMGVLLSYSGVQTSSDRGAIVRSALLFTLGTIIALMIVGGVAGFVGQVAQAGLGKYWKVFAGIVAVALGLATLKLLPFELMPKMSGFNPARLGAFGSALAGLFLGGMVAVSSLPCNPGIFIVMSAAILQGAILWPCLLLGMYAIGFALPLGLLMLGVSLGKFTLAARGADKAVRWIAGPALVIAGFYFVITS